MAFGTPCRSPDISTTSALSMAMSVPVPMARPTSASASAGASLMPSPTKATLPCSALQALDRLDLAVGQHFGHDLVDAEPRGDGLGRAAVVAGDHRDLQAEIVQRRDRLRASSP